MLLTFFFDSYTFRDSYELGFQPRGSTLLVFEYFVVVVPLNEFAVRERASSNICVVVLCEGGVRVGRPESWNFLTVDKGISQKMSSRGNPRLGGC